MREYTSQFSATLLCESDLKYFLFPELIQFALKTSGKPHTYHRQFDKQLSK